MTAVVIPFPSRVEARPETDEARDCRNCVNARHGALTHCVIFAEDILQEQETARTCELFENEETT